MQDFSKIPNEKEMIEIFHTNRVASAENEGILASEVKNHQKKIDLIHIPKNSKSGYGPAHAIEFKVRNWRLGFRQSMRNRLLVPLNSIAIWKNYTKLINLKELKSEGIGLIEVSYERNTTLLTPKFSPYIEKTIYKRIKNHLIELDSKNLR